MVEGIAFENGQISNCEGLVTLTLDRVVLYSVVHHSSTSTHTPNFTEIEKNFLWMDVCTHLCTYIRMDGWTFDTDFIRSTLSKGQPNNALSQGWLVGCNLTSILIHSAKHIQ